MSKVKSYGLKAYVSNAFDLHVGKRIKYSERGVEEKEHSKSRLLVLRIPLFCQRNLYSYRKRIYPN